MIHNIKPDFEKHLLKLEIVDGTHEGYIYGELAEPLIEILDMGVAMDMRIDLEGIIDPPSRMKETISSRRMI